MTYHYLNIRWNIFCLLLLEYKKNDKHLRPCKLQLHLIALIKVFAIKIFTSKNWSESFQEVCQSSRSSKLELERTWSGISTFKSYLHNFVFKVGMSFQL